MNDNLKSKIMQNPFSPQNAYEKGFFVVCDGNMSKIAKKLAKIAKKSETFVTILLK